MTKCSIKYLYTNSSLINLLYTWEIDHFNIKVAVTDSCKISKGIGREKETEWERKREGKKRMKEKENKKVLLGSLILTT